MEGFLKPKQSTSTSSSRSNLGGDTTASAPTSRANLLPTTGGIQNTESRIVDLLRENPNLIQPNSGGGGSNNRNNNNNNRNRNRNNNNNNNNNNIYNGGGR